LKVRQSIYNAQVMANVFGGAIVMKIYSKDSSSISNPVLKGAKLERLVIIDRRNFDVEIDNDVSSINYGLIKTLSVYSDIMSKTTIELHKSRYIMFTGDMDNSYEDEVDKVLGVSVYDSLHDRITRVGSSFNKLDNIFGEFITKVLKIDNYIQLLARKDGIRELLARMKQLDVTSAIHNTTIVDGKETLDKVVSNMGGVADVFVEIMSTLTTYTGIPMALLTGRSSKGLSASGSDDVQLTFFYDNIKVYQEDCLKAPIDSILQSVCDNIGVKKPEFYFVPIVSLSTEKMVACRKVQAETDQIYYNIGTLDSDTISYNRFSGDEYSFETEIDDYESKEINTEEE